MASAGADAAMTTPSRVTPWLPWGSAGASAATGVVGMSTVVSMGSPFSSHSSRPSTQWFCRSGSTSGRAAASNSSWVSVTRTLPSSSYIFQLSSS